MTYSNSEWGLGLAIGIVLSMPKASQSGGMPPGSLGMFLNLGSLRLNFAAILIK